MELMINFNIFFDKINDNIVGININLIDEINEKINWNSNINERINNNFIEENKNNGINDISIEIK